MEEKLNDYKKIQLALNTLDQIYLPLPIQLGCYWITFQKKKKKSQTTMIKSN
jgi:hypothetical protein